MCENNDYGQLLEEYRGMIKSLFSNLIDRVIKSECESFKIRYKEELREEREHIDFMTKSLKKVIK